MNDKNPTPDESSTPDAPTVPVAPASDHPTQPQTPIAEQAPAASAAPAPAAAPKKTGLTRGLLIGGGIAAAVILVGGGIAVGAAIADENDDDRAPFSDGPRDDDQDRGDRGQGQGQGQGQDDRPGDDDGGRGDGPAAGGPVTGIGSASADEIVDVADAARGVAEGDVTSIDAKRDGTWEIELTGSTGGETEVRVAADGTATVVATDDEDDDDTAPTHVLDEETIRALVAAALDEADGLITDLDADEDASSPYDVRVVTDDRRSIEIDLSADFAVVGTDTDD